MSEEDQKSGDEFSDDFNIDQSTIIYNSIEVYVDELNNNSRYQPPPDSDERNLLEKTVFITSQKIQVFLRTSFGLFEHLYEAKN